MNNNYINQDDNLIIQSYYTVCLFDALGSKFTVNKCFQDLKFGNESIKDGLSQVTVQNQGSALMALYAMLVIPKEIIGEQYKLEYSKINSFLEKHCFDVSTNYKSDGNKINFIKHLRNAVAHANVYFEPHKYIDFKDYYKKEVFDAKLPLSKMGHLLNELQKVHLKYIEDRQKTL